MGGSKIRPPSRGPFSNAQCCNDQNKSPCLPSPPCSKPATHNYRQSPRCTRMSHTCKHIGSGQSVLRRLWPQKGRGLRLIGRMTRAVSKSWRQVRKLADTAHALCDRQAAVTLDNVRRRRCHHPGQLPTGLGLGQPQVRAQGLLDWVTFLFWAQPILPCLWKREQAGCLLQGAKHNMPLTPSLPRGQGLPGPTPHAATSVQRRATNPTPY